MIVGGAEMLVPTPISRLDSFDHRDYRGCVSPDEPTPGEVARVSTAEACGSLVVIGGMLAWLAVVTSPASAGILVPIGLAGVTSGVIIVAIARRSARR